jgi:hypothetical protein
MWVYLIAYFKAIWYILWQFAVFCGHLVYFFPFWYVVQRKIWQPCILCLREDWNQTELKQHCLLKKIVAVFGCHASPRKGKIRFLGCTFNLNATVN